MTSDDSSLELVPARITVADITVGARVRRLNDAWEVVVLFSRLPGQQALAAADVQVQLMADDVGPMDLLGAPEGDALPEVGGGLGTTANARYQFGAGPGRPSQLIVHWRSNELRFRLVPPGSAAPPRP